MKSSFGFSLDTKGDRREAVSSTSNNMNISFGYGSATDDLESTHPKVDSHRPSDRNLSDPLKSMDQRSPNTRSRGTKNPNMFVFSSHFSVWFI
jgi:serine/threonine-protein kinase ULK/ATG1